MRSEEKKRKSKSTQNERGITKKSHKKREEKHTRGKKSSTGR